MSRGTVNKVIILGRLGQDPESRATASGTMIVNLNVATTEIGKADDQGQRQELTEWHRITLFGRMAENAAQYLTKGSQVYIEGRLQTRKWQDAQGNDRYSTDIIGNEMQFIGGRNDSGNNRTASPQQQPAPRQQPQQVGGFQSPTGQPAPRPATNDFTDFDDDIGF